MANRLNLEVIIEARDEASAQLQRLSGTAEELRGTFQKMALVGAAGFAAISGAVAISTKRAIESEGIYSRLNKIIQTATGATDEQVAALNEQAKALEDVGVVQATAITQAQAQLATFDLTAGSIATLTPALLDYAVAEKGVGLSTEELKALTNSLAQALQGNFVSLTKTGFVLDDATKALISTGTETQRAEALVKVLNSTYKDFNATARETAEGRLAVLSTEFQNLQEALGRAFIPTLISVVEKLTPVIERVANWIEQNPTLAFWLVTITAGIFGLVAILGTLGLLLPGIITAVGALSAALLFLFTNPIGLVILGIGALIAAGVALVSNWEAIKEQFLAVWELIKMGVSNAIDFISNKFNSAVDFIMQQVARIRSAISSVTGALSRLPGVGAIRGLVGLADGGIVTRPTIAQIGEDGAEAVIPLDKLNNFGGGVNVNLKVDNLFSDDADRLGTLIGDALISRLNLNMRL